MANQGAYAQLKGQQHSAPAPSAWQCKDRAQGCQISLLRPMFTFYKEAYLLENTDSS